MFDEAKRRWAAQGLAPEIGFVQIEHVGDANAYVSIHRATTDRVDFFGNGIYFRASTGEVIHEEPPQSAVRTVEGFIEGLHFQHFRHWLLRWLYFVGGLAGCACIATGFIFFVEKRKRQHARSGSQGARVVDALAVTAVTGMLIATLALLMFNRVLPADLAGRDVWEEAAFWIAWLLAFAHAAWRTAPVAQARFAPAWADQTWAVAGLALTTVLLNWITTGDHLIKTVAAAYWPVAGIDLVLLASAGIAARTALRLRRAERGLAATGHDPAASTGADAQGALRA